MSVSPLLLRTLQLFCSSFFNTACLAILGFLLARILSVEEFGVVREVGIYWGVILMLGHLCLHDGMAALILKDQSKSACKRYITTAVLSASVSSIGIMLCAWLGYFVLNTFFTVSLTLSLLVSLSLCLPFASVTVVLTSTLMVLGKISANAVLNVLNSLVFFIFIYIFTLYLGVSGWLIGRVLSVIVILGLIVFFIKTYIDFRFFSLVEVRKLLRLSFWQLPGGLISMLQQSVDILVLGFFVGNQSVGLYAFLLLFIKGFGVIHNSVAKVFFKKLNNINSHKIFMFYMCLASSLAVVFNMIFSLQVIDFFYKEKFSLVTEYLPIMSLSLVFSGIVTGFSYINIANEEFKRSTYISIIQLIVSLPVYCVLAQGYGLPGVIYTYVFLSLFHAVISFYLYKVFPRQSDLPKKSVVNMES